jgi:methanogenic corrinoid protein MtbC1
MELEAALLSMNRSLVRGIFMRGVEARGTLPFMETVVADVLDTIGADWQAGKVALSQVYMAGRICEELSLSVLPLAHGDRKHQPRIGLAQFEDYHTLGKRMVLAVLRNEGYAVADWGQLNLVSAIDRLRREPVDVLLLSCLMLSSALRIGKLTKLVQDEGLPVRIAVGGAPFRFDPRLWREVGADAMGSSASAAGGIVRQLAGGPA